MSKEIVTQKVSLLEAIAKQWGVAEIDPKKLYDTLKATAFKPIKKGDGHVPVTDDQFVALMIVSKQYNLNPFLREIYAFPAKDGSIVPVVGVDGWANIINSHPQMDGIEYKYSDNVIKPDGGKSCPEWIECIITRKDRTKPIVVREYLDECYKKDTYPGPWQSHTKRFLRHKATIQAARIAFGFSGIYDPDEAENIKDVTPPQKSHSSSIDELNAEFLRPKTPVIDIEEEGVNKKNNDEPRPINRIKVDQIKDTLEADWGTFVNAFVNEACQAPDIDWLQQFKKHHEGALNNFAKEAALDPGIREIHQRLINTLNETERSLAG